MDSTTIDLYDLDQYERSGVPHEALAHLRAHDPVAWMDEPDDGVGFWAITRYQDVVDISRNPMLFSSYRGGSNITDYPPDDLSKIRMLMVNMDPPQHVKFRKLVSTGFTPRMVQALEGRVRASVDGIIDRVIGWGECDFVREIAAELPLQVIAELLGIPLEERQVIFDLSNRLIGFDDPEFQTSLEDAQLASAEMWMYANNLATGRRGQSGTDLITVLMNAEIDGEHLTEMEFDSFFLLLSVAGNETTRNLISGGMRALLANPEQWERLKANPDLVDTAVEEMLRWVSPLIHFRRTATEDTVIRGQEIKEGDKVVLYYPSANRDEEIFQDAHLFDVGRTPNEHLAFGVGEHFCLGANLARLEIRWMFKALIERMPDIELNGETRRLRSNFINGIKEMPVRFTPA